MIRSRTWFGTLALAAMLASTSLTPMPARADDAAGPPVTKTAPAHGDKCCEGASAARAGDCCEGAPQAKSGDCCANAPDGKSRDCCGNAPDGKSRDCCKAARDGKRGDCCSDGERGGGRRHDGHGWGRHHRGGWAHRDPLARLKERVDLTPEQVSKLQPIVDAHSQQMKQQFEAGRQQFLAVLTPEQRAQLDKMKAAREEAMQKHDWKALHEMKGGPEALNLTEAQKTQLKSLRETAFKQMREQHEQFEKEFMAQADTVLTPEQKESLLRQSIFGRPGGWDGRGRDGHRRERSDGDKKTGDADVDDMAPTN
jgi:Spy/CpxP family protein refolding chaperone